MLISTAVVSVAVDWNDSHIFNADWEPHAKFHDVVMLHLLCGVCIIGLWLLWRRSPEPEIGARVAALIPTIFWAAFFYTTPLVPGTSLSADPQATPMQILGIATYPNVLVAFVSIVLAVLGYWLYRTGTTLRDS
ncbi:MAG: DUF6640 family protein [Leptolyngbyaceae cyanobacterium]